MLCGKGNLLSTVNRNVQLPQVKERKTTLHCIQCVFVVDLFILFQVLLTLKVFVNFDKRTTTTTTTTMVPCHSDPGNLVALKVATNQRCRMRWQRPERGLVFCFLIEQMTECMVTNRLSTQSDLTANWFQSNIYINGQQQQQQQQMVTPTRSCR